MNRFAEMLDNVRASQPLVHCITNYVTVNDCANILLACGASPIMADDEAEVEDIISICSALDINIGTLNGRTVSSMLKAGTKARSLGRPVILDPVGAGASQLRTSTAIRLVSEIAPDVIRGNISEIKTLADGCGNTNGVDADIRDSISEENLAESVDFMKSLSGKLNAVIAVTGAIDIVADNEKAYVIRNGHPMLSRITGSGCMLSALTTAFCAANPASLAEASAAAVAMMGLCGELAHEKTLECGGGTGSFRAYLIDEASLMDGSKLEGGMKIEIR